MCPPNAKECQSEETTHKTKTHSNATINKMGSSHSSNATAIDSWRSNGSGKPFQFDDFSVHLPSCKLH